MRFLSCLTGETFKKVLTSAKDALDFKLDKLLSAIAPLDETQRRILDDILNVMASAPQIPGAAAQVKRELIINRLAHRLKLRQEKVWARSANAEGCRAKRTRTAAERTRTGTARAEPETGVGVRRIEAGRGDAHNRTPARSRKLSPEAAAEHNWCRCCSLTRHLCRRSAKLTPDEITHTGFGGYSRNCT